MPQRKQAFSISGAGRQARAAAAYANRSGFPEGTSPTRGAAKDFEPPGDFRVPDPLRPWEAGGTASTGLGSAGVS